MGVVASLSRSERAFWSSMIQVIMGEANDTLRMFRLLRSVTHAEMYILLISLWIVEDMQAYKHSCGISVLTPEGLFRFPP